MITTIQTKTGEVYEGIRIEPSDSFLKLFTKDMKIRMFSLKNISTITNGRPLSARERELLMQTHSLLEELSKRAEAYERNKLQRNLLGGMFAKHFDFLFQIQSIALSEYSNKVDQHFMLLAQEMDKEDKDYRESVRLAAKLFPFIYQ